VWVKVVSKTGQRLGLAMRDVDQVTGVDQLPMQRGGPSADGRSNPSGPTGANSQSALHGLSGIKVGLDCGGWLQLHAIAARAKRVCPLIDLHLTHSPAVVPRCPTRPLLLLLAGG
jgi:hypothetical protein